MSYLNYDGTNEDLQYADLRLRAAIAGAEGVDTRHI